MLDIRKQDRTGVAGGDFFVPQWLIQDLYKLQWKAWLKICYDRLWIFMDRRQNTNKTFFFFLMCCVIVIPSKISKYHISFLKRKEKKMKGEGKNPTVITS